MTWWLLLQKLLMIVITETPEHESRYITLTITWSAPLLVDYWSPIIGSGPTEENVSIFRSTSFARSVSSTTFIRVSNSQKTERQIIVRTKLSLCEMILLSLGGYLCWNIVNPRMYHPLSSKCFGTDMDYYIIK
jgi:hypothetical protein